ncbi:MAG: 23S rRNA (pseudouridine(1915)-N(3))-methyltransferase RlmH [Myxococcales bacterium]|nr:MAG: 23S rRNA (pseudouridine(1915)-N(3))-methyltransferase RlmH [Myxococcales bacterium]
MQVLVISVGRLKDKELKALIQDYGKRISRFTRFDEKEIKDAQLDTVREQIERAIPKRSRTIALEVQGKSFTSPQFAAAVEHARHDAIEHLVFIIGGAYGLPKTISDQADLKLSLSTMTLPHRLARLLLLEQIYRAFSILANEPYAHES